MTARQRRPEVSTTDRIPERGRRALAKEGGKAPAGVQGANSGYWQAGGVTRSGAKRTKRP
jgi:hypothetical protein